MSCTNLRVPDIAAAVDVPRHRKIAPGVEFYNAAVSSLVQREAKELDIWIPLFLLAQGFCTLPLHFL